MDFLTTAVLVLSGAAGLLIALVLGVRALVLRRRGRRPRWLRHTVIATAALVPVHAFVVLPAALGYLGSRSIGTRGDERDWAGPRLAADGTWLIGDAAAGTGVFVTPVSFVAADGVALRAFLVPPATVPPRATVVLVHGLFRGGLELEPPAEMFRDLGCEVLLLELRNHGGSARAPATFGRDESLDVVAAAAWARSRSTAAAERPLVLFGVSLGTAAVALAAPRVPNLGGVVLDAPLTDVVATAHRMLGRARGRRRFSIPEPIRSAALIAVELWSGVDLESVRPVAAMQRLPPDVPVLVIGGGTDDRMPPAEVREFHRRLPQPAARKMLWIHPTAGHGDVWATDPSGYRERLAAFLQLVAPR